MISLSFSHLLKEKLQSIFNFEDRFWLALRKRIRHSYPFRKGIYKSYLYKNSAHKALEVVSKSQVKKLINRLEHSCLELTGAISYAKKYTSSEAKVAFDELPEIRNRFFKEFLKAKAVNYFGNNKLKLLLNENARLISQYETILRKIAYSDVNPSEKEKFGEMDVINNYTVHNHLSHQ